MVAEKEISQVIHKICQRAWETEVIKKKESHSVNWVLSQANEMQNVQVKPDPNLN